MSAKVQLVDIDDARQQLIEAEFGSHFLLTYTELDMWRSLYPSTVKKYLLDDNSIVLVIPFYETTQIVRQALALEIPMFEKYEINGSIVVIDSIKAYFSEIGIMTFVDGLLKHAKSSGKSGISVFADMGSFAHIRKMHQLVEHEISLPAKYDAKLRGYCIYHKDNFDKLIPQQKQAMYEHHEKNMIITSR
jgi:hypothetical protein